MAGRNLRVRLALLPRSFPAPAAGYTRGCPVPFSRTSTAAKLTIRICTTDRNLHEALAPDAAGHVCAGRGNLPVGYGKCRARLWFTAAGFCDDLYAPKSVIRCLGVRWSSSEKRRNKQSSSNAVEAHDQVPDCVIGRGYPGTLCLKFAAMPRWQKFQQNQIFDLFFCSPVGTG